MAITLTELQHFVEKNEIGEPFNYDAEFPYYHYDKNGALTGIVVYCKDKDISGREYPRFIHIILDESIRRSKEAYSFVLDTFKDLRSKGWETVVAVIPHWKKYMILLAMKLRFTKYAEDKEYGYWFVRIDDVIRR